MKLLVTAQALDRDDPVCGFLDRWISRIALRVRDVVVIAGKVGRRSNGLEVVSLGKESGAGRPARLTTFFREALSKRQVDAVLVLQIPETAVALGPIFKARGIPIYLWYAHRSCPAALRAALPFVRRVFTSHESAMRLPTPKRTVIGQGIDTEFFQPGPGSHEEILCVGRISRIKDPATLLKASRLLKRPTRIRFIGAPLTDADRRYARDTGVEGEGFVPPDRMPELYGSAAATVNLAPTGAPDKAALEAMACGIPTLACNESIPLPPELRFRRGDAASLAQALDPVLAMPPKAREALGHPLRAAVEAGHSLRGFVDSIVGHIEDDRG